MKHILETDFIAFVRTLQKQELTTRAGRSKFAVEVNGKGLIFYPASTDTPRPHTQSYVQKVLNKFNQDGSFATTDYRFTVNASYMLTLIDLYLAQSKSV